MTNKQQAPPLHSPSLSKSRVRDPVSFSVTGSFLRSPSRQGADVLAVRFFPTDIEIKDVNRERHITRGRYGGHLNGSTKARTALENCSACESEMDEGLVLPWGFRHRVLLIL